MIINKFYFFAKKKLSCLLEKTVTFRHSTTFRSAPVFVLGLPRSGTTLLYQYIVHRLKVSYFMNGTDQFPHAAVLNTLLRYKWYGEYISNFANKYGKVVGANAPHEAGSFWGRFFGLQKYVRYSDIDYNTENALRKNISSIEQVFGYSSFVNKNVKHILRVDALAHIFPKAFFIIIHRDLKDIGLSLIRGRYKKFGSADQWWSVRPPNWKELDNMEPAVQIAHQVICLRNKLVTDIEAISKNRVSHIKYKTFCDNPEQYLSEIATQFSIGYKATSAVNSFQISTNSPKTEEERKLVEALNKFDK